MDLGEQEEQYNLGLVLWMLPMVPMLKASFTFCLEVRGVHWKGIALASHQHKSWGE